jgi:hypothetical protein
MPTMPVARFWSLELTLITPTEERRPSENIGGGHQMCYNRFRSYGVLYLTVLTDGAIGGQAQRSSPPESWFTRTSRHSLRVTGASGMTVPWAAGRNGEIAHAR